MHGPDPTPWHHCRWSFGAHALRWYFHESLQDPKWPYRPPLRAERLRLQSPGRDLQALQAHARRHDLMDLHLGSSRAPGQDLGPELCGRDAGLPEYGGIHDVDCRFYVWFECTYALDMRVCMVVGNNLHRGSQQGFHRVLIVAHSLLQ